MSVSEWLEPLNAVHFAQSTMLAGLLAVVLWVKRRDFYELYYSLVAAMFTYHVGAALAWGWRWVWRWSYTNRYYDLLDFIETIQAPMIAAALMAIGLACKVRVLTSEAWGHWPWIIFLMLSVAFSIVVTY